MEKQQSDAKRKAKKEFFDLVFFKLGKKNTAITQHMLEVMYDELKPGNPQFGLIEKANLRKYLKSARDPRCGKKEKDDADEQSFPSLSKSGSATSFQSELEAHLLMNMTIKAVDQMEPYKAVMKPHHYNTVIKGAKLAIATDEDDFKKKLNEYFKDVMNGDLFTDIFSALVEMDDHLSNQENDPAGLNDEQRIAALNFLFSDATSGMRYGEYLNSFKHLVIQFVSSIEYMKAFQKLDRISDPQVLNCLNTWGAGDDWVNAESCWIHLNLHLGNFTCIQLCLDGVNRRQDNSFVEDTVLKNSPWKSDVKKKDAQFVKRVSEALLTLYSFKKEVSSKLLQNSKKLFVLEFFMILMQQKASLQHDIVSVLELCPQDNQLSERMQRLLDVTLDRTDMWSKWLDHRDTTYGQSLVDLIS